MRRILGLILPFLLLFGCGGGGGGSGGGGGGSKSTPVSFTLNWPARSRVISGPASALSFVLTLRSADPSGADFTATVNRNAGTAAYTQPVTTSNPAKTGTWTLAATFYAAANGSGDVVGVGAAQPTIADDGTGIGDVAITGTVASVQVTAGQSVLAGATQDLAWGAHDASGRLLALSPGSATFSVTAGADKLQFVNQQANGLLPGNATVTAAVDGVVSPAQTVHVTSNTTIAATPTPVNVPAGGTQAFSAQVTNAPNTAVTWSVVETGGGTINQNGSYTAPATAGVYHVMATSQYDPDKTAQATVTVTVGVVINPPNVTITLGDSQSFTASALGSSDTGIVWSVQEGAAGGAVTQSGGYTAPNVAGTYHVVATSHADATKFAKATVTVQAGSASGTIN